MKKPLLIVLVIILNSGSIFAQWNFYLNTQVSYDENLLRTYRPLPDRLITPMAGLSYIGRNYELFYTTEVTGVVSHSQYNYHTHTLGIDFFNANRRSFKYNWGFNLSARFDRPLYSQYDYYLARGYCDFSWNVRDWTLVKFGGEFYRKIFPDEPAWNNWEANLNYTQSFFLPTRSTLRLELSYLRRDFSPVDLNPGDYDWSVGEYLDSMTSYQAELPTLNQMLGGLRWAQSFGPRLGGYTEFSYRFNTTKGNPYQLEQVSFSPIDDYFGFQGTSWNTSLKWQITQRLWLRGNYSLYTMNYVNRPVFAYDFANESWLTDSAGYLIELAPQRQDKGDIISLYLGYNWENVGHKAADLEMMLQLSYYRNASNDPYFEYDDYAIALRLAYDFQW